MPEGLFLDRVSNAPLIDRYIFRVLFLIECNNCNVKLSMRLSNRQLIWKAFTHG
jgi:hypothetical protein